MYADRSSLLKAGSMRKLVILFGVAALSACGSMPAMQSSVQSSFNGESYDSGPTSIRDPRFANPAFYSESDGMRLPSFE
jgi:hypothetical protein